MESQPPAEKKNNNKIIIIVGVVLLVCVCAVVILVAALAILGPAIQKTSQKMVEGVGYSGIADEQLKTDVLNALTDFETKQNNCSDVSLLGGQLILSPDQTSDHSWTATWQLNACGASHLYSITF